MLAVRLNRENYEYDIQALLKSFYPEEPLRIITPASREQELREGEREWSIRIEEPLVHLQLAGREVQWRHEEEEGAFKDCFKRFFYRSLVEITGRELPWGNLTGIRPTKLAYAMLEEGKADEEIAAQLQQTHYVSREKCELSIEIARRERALLSGIHYQGGYSLYIGIPFCPSTCLYCSFTSYPIEAHRQRVEQYIDCVIREMEYVSKRYEDKLLDTVYIGGGTPTTLEPEQLDRLLGSLKSLFDFSAVQEFTVEAGRADSITREKLEVLRRHGVSRISVNPQTMKQETLDIIGRKATVTQLLEAYRLARQGGFD
ncbi:MAG: coproporphyrinogen dehydrogenase HemZ, partial [Acetatifactor sp.]|nr:coproporphyrinogen dehydrogenase HemZ [Acetatifactor sp.]